MTWLVCPTCKVGLEIGDGRYVCPGCGTGYPVRHGIVCFGESPTYYGELEATEMRALLQAAEASGWRIALASQLAGTHASLVPTIADPGRASWTSLLRLGGHERVLDLGCGLGGVSVPLAEHVAEVTAMDGCFDRIRFLQIRRDQDGLRNITLVCHDAVHALPFADASFDLVALNMVFPYLAASLPGHPVPVADAILMREIARTLKPAGQLYLAVRNRFCLHRLRRALLGFGGAPGADNFVPQSHGYYRALLEGSGIARVRSFWAIPNYKVPRRLIPLEGSPPELLRYVREAPELSTATKVLAAVAARVGRLRFLAETIAFVGEKRDGSPG